MAPDDTCPDCAGAGYYTLAVPIGHPDFGKLLPCACRMRAREQRAQEQQAHHTQAVLAELARTLGRLAYAWFDTFDLQRPLVELVWGGATFSIDVQRQALAQPAGWLYLCGPCGAGKSHLAAAIANHLAMRGQGVTYASVPDLLRFVRRGFGERTADERLDALMAIDVLILDDLGAEHLTAWAAEQLFVLLNARYLNERATVLTSNDRPEALPARLQSRIAEQAQLIWMPISDYRQLKAGGERRQRPAREANRAGARPQGRRSARRVRLNAEAQQEHRNSAQGEPMKLHPSGRVAIRFGSGSGSMPRGCWPDWHLWPPTTVWSETETPISGRDPQSPIRRPGRRTASADPPRGRPLPSASSAPPASPPRGRTTPG